MTKLHRARRTLALSIALTFSAGAYAAGQLPSAQFALGNVSLERTYVAESPDLSKFVAEDGKVSGGPFRYGVEVATPNLAIRAGRATRGERFELDDGRVGWRLAVVSPGAKSLDFGLTDVVLPEGAELFVASADRSVLRGPITAADIQADGRYYTAYVPGDTATIEVVAPRAVAKRVSVNVANVTHAYRGLFEDALSAKSGSCNVDVACPLGNTWGDQIDAVGHYTFRQGASTYVCTGTLTANTNRDTTPYFLTANHCVSSETVADTIVVYWNYQNPTCRTPGSSASGTPISSSTASHTQSGTQLVATNSASDFALLRLDAAVPAGADAYWSGWDNRDVVPTYVVGIHHPAGHEKRIADSAQAVARSSYSGAPGSGTSHWRIPDWDNGTTEGGSSGSGLFNQDRRLIGQLHGGSAACGNNLQDYYGRLNMSWNGGGSAATRLRDWLDPTSSGATTLDGNRGGTPPPPPPPNTLTNGVPVSGLSAATGGELRFTMAVPAGASNLRFVTSSGSGDGDLYVRFGSAPTRTTNDCKSEGGTNAETCNIATAQAGTYHVLVYGYAAFSGLSLTGSYGTTPPPPPPATFTNSNNFNITDNATVESPIAVTGRTGNAPSNLQVAVDIKHTYKGDLKVDLIAPDGSVYVLHNRTGGSADNIIQTFTVNASSEVANGTWRLRVNDNAGGDVGIIDSWSLTF